MRLKPQKRPFFPARITGAFPHPVRFLAALSPLEAFDTLGLSRVVADFDAPNKASIRVLEELGMSQRSRAVVNDHALLYFEIQTHEIQTRNRDESAEGSTAYCTDCLTQIRLSEIEEVRFLRSCELSD